MPYKLLQYPARTGETKRSILTPIRTTMEATHQLPGATADADHALVKAAQSNSDNFAALYQKYYIPIFRFVHQRLDDQEMAYDITSQVFLKAMLNLKNYKFQGLPFSSWLYRIARNEVYDLFTKKKAQRTLNMDTESLGNIAEELADEGLAQYQPQLAKAMAALEESDLQLVEMRYFEKRAFKEIGEILDITENNAKVKLYRVLDKLKRAITQNKA